MNTSGWFASLVTLPVVIDAPGAYLTRGGERVEIFHVVSRHAFACRGRYSCGVNDQWHPSGRLYFGTLSNNDVVSKVSAP